MRKSILQLFLLIGILIATTHSSTHAQCPDNPLEDGNVMYEDAKHDIFKSIGQWDNGCTATFIKTSDDLNAPAYVLTNGHCIDLTTEEANLVKINYDPPGDEFIEFNNFTNTQDQIIRVNPIKIEYATMKDVDLALVRLEHTIGEMIALGLEPISISQEEPQIGDDVKIFGYPIALGSVLRYSSCNFTGTAPLVIENAWVWRDMFKNDCDGVKPGSSGSPVFSCIDKGFYGMLNTSNRDFEFPCEISSPCEVNSLREEFDAGKNYVIDIRNVLRCFNKDGIVDTSLIDFPYDLGDQITPLYRERLTTGLSSANQINPDLPKSDKALDISLSDKQYYRYKFESLEESSPWELNGFGEVIDQSVDSIIHDPYPAEEGIYFVSIIAGDTPSYDSTWQSIDQPTVIPFIIDKTPPTYIPDIIDTGLNPNGFEIIIEVISGFHQFTTWRFGPVDFDKNDLSEYTNFISFIPYFYPFEEAPFKICAFISDSAGNKGEINCEIFDLETNTDDPNEEKNILIYPNPTSNEVNIQALNSIGLNDVVLYDMLGKPVYTSSNLKAQSTKIDVRNIPTGTYLITIKTEKGFTVKRIVIE